MRYPWTCCDDVVEQRLLLFSTVGLGLVKDGRTSCALPSKRNPLRVASKFADILLHPFQGEVHVEQSGVEGPILLHLRARQEAESTQPILDNHNDEAVPVGGHEFRGVETSGTK